MLYNCDIIIGNDKVDADILVAWVQHLAEGSDATFTSVRVSHTIQLHTVHCADNRSFSLIPVLWSFVPSPAPSHFFQQKSKPSINNE
jgi:hypothetical protein